MRILVVEDEKKLAGLIRRVLVEEGHVVELAHDGEEGLAAASAGDFDLVILDVMLPRLDGVRLCRRLREARNSVPVLMLTARDAIDDRVAGLDAGADDYLVKPFAFAELLARVRALGRRRAEPWSPATLRVGDLELDLARRVARRNGKEVELTAREFTLLELLMRHPGQVLTRTQILDRVWGFDAEAGTNVVETYVHYLRSKLDAPNLIRTVRGVGYALRG